MVQNIYYKDYDNSKKYLEVVDNCEQKGEFSIVVKIEQYYMHADR